MNENVKKIILKKLGCGHLNPACFLSIKLGFDGCCSFKILKLTCVSRYTLGKLIDYIDRADC